MSCLLGGSNMFRGKYSGRKDVRVPMVRTSAGKPWIGDEQYHSFLTTICPIEVIPNHHNTDSIRARIAESGVTDNPFARCPMVHMARLVVLDELRPALGDLDAREIKSKYLMLMADIDGSVDDFLDCLYRENTEFVHDVWGRCLGYPEYQGAVFFRRYMKRCAQPAHLPFAAFPKRSVDDIRRALSIQDQLTHWIANHHGRDVSRELWHAMLDRLDSRVYVGETEALAFEPGPAEEVKVDE